MPQKANIMKTSDEITTKQKAFVDILVENWGQISKKDAIIKAGFSGKNENSAMVMGSRLTNPSLNPHVCRYLEKRMAEEQSKYEKDKLHI